MTESSDPSGGSADEPRTPFWDWPRAAHWVVFGALGLVLVLLVTTIMGVVLVRRSFPQTEGTMRIAGLEESVEVRRDARGIPQVYADTSADLFFAQGFVQAQDRFWEMDYRRHLASGRLSELIGRAGLESDMAVRTLGWRRVAEQELLLLAPDTRAHLEAFSAGVNAYIRGRGLTRLSLEYVVLGLGGLDYTAEQWTPVDSLAWLKAMAWDLRGNLQDEIDRARLSVSRSPERIAELYPAYPFGEHEPITEAIDATGAATDARDAALLGSSSGLGSNSWVVSGRHTTTGKPLLANDPHDAPSSPGVWYQMGLHCRAVSAECPFDASGFTFAGVPGVIIGHNDRVAWGLTNLGADATDLFLEKVDGKNFYYEQQWRPLVERDEIIRIAGEPSKKITVRSTGHGPLLSDVSRELSSVGANARVPEGSPERDNGYAVALAWTGLRPARTADAIFGFNSAQDWREFRTAARLFAVPSQSLVYADTAGNIGYQAAGKVPVRRNGRTGLDPAAGWLARNDWTGQVVPFGELPSLYNPPSGIIVAANQAVTGPGYRHRLASTWEAGFRSERIRTLLARELETGKLDVADLTRIQRDTLDPMARELVPYLLDVLLPSRYYSAGQRILSDWDFRQDADSAGAAYFSSVWRNLLRLTFHDQLRESLWPDGGDRWFLIVSKLLREPNSPWWDDARTDSVIENRDLVLRQALRDARDELTRRVDRDPAKWTWGALHRLDLDNPSLGIDRPGLVRALFNRGPFELAGGGSVVAATAWDATRGYDATAVASMRMVVNLADFDASRWISLTGASGHAFSGHYVDQTRLWAQGKYLPWRFTEESVEQQTDQLLELIPR